MNKAQMREGNLIRRCKELDTENEKLFGILQECYDEHMHFGWGYEELHDKIIATLGDRLRPAQEIIDDSCKPIKWEEMSPTERDFYIGIVPPQT